MIRVFGNRIHQETVDGNFRVGDGMRDVSFILFEPRSFHRLCPSFSETCFVQPPFVPFRSGRSLFISKGLISSNPPQVFYPFFRFFAMYSAKVERVMKTFSPSSRLKISTP